MASLLISHCELRRTAFALRAFNVELAQIRDLTKSNMISQVRFQFWLDTIDDLYSNKSNQFDNLEENNFNNFPIAFELKRVKVDTKFF